MKFIARASVKMAGSIGLAALVIGTVAIAQDTAPQDGSGNPPQGKNPPHPNYYIHESYDAGGRIANKTGSASMYNTMVNLQTGPRVLNQTLEVHAFAGAKHPLFDTLYADSTGYGGDPNDYTNLNMRLGRIYDFQGTFRRDRQYFDYDLLGNPLIPANDTVHVAGTGGASSYSVTYPQVENAPHMFNTVRRMTDLSLTLFPLSLFTFRTSYSDNIMQGPTYSSIHLAGEGLLLQNWRNSSDTWLGGIDWKPVRGTILTFEEHVMHYKGNTSLQLAALGLNAKLANGTPVSLGFDAAPAASCYSTASGSTTPPTTTGKCAGYISYTGSSPRRTIFPTEEFRFQSSTIKNIQMTGRVLYTEGNMNMPAYYTSMVGLQTRSPNPSIPSGSYALVSTTNGRGYARRIDTGADYGIVWHVTDAFSLSEQYNFQYFRQPATGSTSETDQYGPELIGATPTGTTATPVVSSANNFLGQKLESNTITGEWDPSVRIQVSLGLRYRGRTLNVLDSATGFNYAHTDHTNSTVLNLILRPNPKFEVRSSVETGWDDNPYVQTNARQFEQYQIHALYKPATWATFSGTFNDLEKRDNETLVNFLSHSRSYSASASMTPNEYISVEMNYGYADDFSRSTNCFGDPAGSQPADATQLPAGVTCGNLPSGTTLAWYGTSYYDAPSQYGLANIVVSPVKMVQTVIGYRITSIGGTTEFLNPAEVPGTLQSKYQSPYMSATLRLRRDWAVKGEWDYNDYGENGAVGPTAPRNFHSNLITMSVHYEY
jgi:hypothetical protein